MDCSVGFWTALMYESGEEDTATLFDRLVSALKEGDESRDIYLTGKLSVASCTSSTFYICALTCML